VVLNVRLFFAGWKPVVQAIIATMKQRILILCTGNSARSQIAEGLFRSKASDSIDVFSAGTKPKSLNPLAVKVMKELGLDISGHRSKDVSQFSQQQFDVVITVCDNAKESCPVFPGAKTIHWSIKDPEDLVSFRKIRDELDRRIQQFLTNLNSGQSKMN
jgi:arsenate reductase